jgi:hypothetical protein
MIKTTKTRVVPMQVNAFCDECGYRVAFNGNMTATIPPKYEHVCSDCFHVEFLDKTYPYIEFIADDSVTDTHEFDDVLSEK